MGKKLVAYFSASGTTKKIAEMIYERHRILSQWLESLGVSRETASEDACRIEHVISEKSFAAVQAHLEQVTKMREDAHGQ